VINQDDLRTLTDATVYDKDGDKVGKVKQVYFDDTTEQPKWVTVTTGLFGTNVTFVPLQSASIAGDRVEIGYDKATVKDAPNIDAEGHLSVQEEEQLYRYYSLDYGTGSAGFESGRTGTVGTDRQAGDYRESGHATEGTTTDGRHAGGVDAGGAGYDERADRGDRGDDRAMTRSEEQLRVGTETHEAGRARLRKHVVTEQQQVSVPVSREEVTLEREPITDANRGDAYDGAEISEAEHEVTLREERPVVDKEAVPVERVRLGTETHTDEETVGGEVRKEQIEFDDDDVRNRRR
jgi:uncharacterized protein (TIGR02271 family)